MLEDPNAVLYRQVDRIKTDLMNRLKAEGVPFEERIHRLDEVSHAKPFLEFIEATFAIFRKAHPWVRGEDIHPKSIAREIYEGYHSFNGYVRHYGLQRSEGVLLRYLSQFYKTMAQTVPERAKTEDALRAAGLFPHDDRARRHQPDRGVGKPAPSRAGARPRKSDLARRELRFYELFHDPKAFGARVRAELHTLVRALAEADYEEAEGSVRPGHAGQRGDPGRPRRFQIAMASFLAERGPLVFNAAARHAQNTHISSIGPRQWAFTQVLVDGSRRKRLVPLRHHRPAGSGRSRDPAAAPASIWETEGGLLGARGRWSPP